MKKMILSLVAALTVGGAFATAADAQHTVVRTTHHRTIVHRTVIHRDGHYAGRTHHRTCKTVWRHHKRIRTCRTW